MYVHDDTPIHFPRNVLFQRKFSCVVHHADSCFLFLNARRDVLSVYKYKYINTININIINIGKPFKNIVS